MSEVAVAIGEHIFPARFEAEAAPLTCAAVGACLPLQAPIIHARWSGEACWAPLGERSIAPEPENPTAYGAPGQVLLYEGKLSETELLVPYGPVRFASKAGMLAGSHFLTIIDRLDLLGEIGRAILWHGASRLRIDWPNSSSFRDTDRAPCRE
jgi:hypothetical protein